MPSYRMKFSDYVPVDMEQLRPSGSYGKMVEIRRQRMQHYLDEEGQVRSELVERIPCPLCNRDNYQELFTKEGFHFVQCEECNLVFVNPQIKADAVVDLYKDKSYSEIIESLVASSNDYRKQRFGEERMDIVGRFVPDQGSQRRLLDVGCATGFFLEAARERGWEVYGIEANPYAAEVALKKGLQVQNTTIEAADYHTAFFDAVTIFEVIEHVRDPLSILVKTHELLRPGGMLFVYTPNFDCAERLIMGSECHFI